MVIEGVKRKLGRINPIPLIPSDRTDCCRLAFGDEISSEGRAQIVREFYQHFVRTMLDLFLEPAPNELKFLALR
jgi:hypothetical protein